jgi:hypothetical protein
MYSRSNLDVDADYILVCACMCLQIHRVLLLHSVVHKSKVLLLLLLLQQCKYLSCFSLQSVHIQLLFLIYTQSTVSGTSTLSGYQLSISTFPTPTVPSHIASQCQLANSTPLPVRLSSACSCISIFPSTATSTIVASTVTITASARPAHPPPPLDELAQRLL